MEPRSRRIRLFLNRCMKQNKSMRRESRTSEEDATAAAGSALTASIHVHGTATAASGISLLRALPSSLGPLFATGSLGNFLDFFGTSVAADIETSLPGIGVPAISHVDRLFPRGLPGPAGREGRLTASHWARISFTRTLTRSILSTLTPSPRSTVSHNRLSSPSSVFLQRARLRNGSSALVPGGHASTCHMSNSVRVWFLQLWEPHLKP